MSISTEQPNVLTRNTPIGQVFRGRPKKVTRERLWTFSGGPFTLDGWPKRNLHTDPAVAAQVGLPSVSASGTQYQGYVVQLLLELFGDAWLTHGTMSAKFIAVVDADETLRATATVTAVEPPGDAVESR
ncbi:MAG: MaoC family dehydratase [Solirubrobacterales bacterium]